MNGVNWEIEYEYNSASVDTVLDINPSEGALVSKGDTVHIKASRGTKISTTTIVPSLIGKKEKDAKVLFQQQDKSWRNTICK